MNSKETPFPVGAKTFYLRSDLAQELCFDDYATSRAYKRQVDKAVYTGTEIGVPIVDAYDPDLCQSHRQSRFFIYCSVGMKTLGIIAAHVCNGKVWMPVHVEGLYQEMLERAALAYGEPGKVLVSPPLANEYKTWVYPPLAVLHDTANARAAIVPYETAHVYLEKHNG